jgi:L-fucose mutarotase|tara:strand:- start:104 stop:481 length:378 start_codon:yes stop_codon:yes gene_type:complete
MGHGDEVVLADVHFPGETMGRRCLRADGLQVADLLDGILPLFCLDAYVQAPLSMMAAVDGDQHDPGVESAYRSAVDRYWPDTPPIAHLERFAFYERAKEAFAVVMTGDTAKYGNLILTKGVTPVP